MTRTVPVNVLYFMPGQFGLQAPVCQSDDAETLFSVILQHLCKVLWHCRAQQEKEFDTLNGATSIPKRFYSNSMEI